MGCVLGKGNAGGIGARRRKKKDENRGSKSTGGIVQNGGDERERNEKIVEASASASAAALPVSLSEFRLKRGFSTGDVGWPAWLIDVAGDAIKDWKPRRANTFEKLDKIGQGTYSNVYKARDLITGNVVALKKVRFDNLERETVRFMAREILVLRKLDHPNVIKLEGLVISRMSSSLYLVFEYMEHDLAGLAAIQSSKFTQPQVKCYMKQLLSGLEHCHNNGVLHRDIKCSNLLIDNEGILRIADFGLATFFDPERRRPMTSRVITLWYRPPELLLGASYYGAGVDLWSAGCILAELLSGKPILRGRTEVEQLHKIFKICGSPSEEYWKKSRLPNATLYKPQQPYKRCLAETLKDFPPPSLALIETLLTIDPDARGTATAALNSDFFNTEPYACDPSSLPKFPPSKEMDIKLREEENRRQRGIEPKPQAIDGNRRGRARDKVVSRAIPAPEANAELQMNLDRLRLMSDTRAKSKSEKFPPPHEDAAVGHTLHASQNGPPSFSTADSSSFSSFIFDPKSSRSLRNTSSKVGASGSRSRNDESQRAPTRSFVSSFYPSFVVWDFRLRLRRRKASSENFG